MFIRTEDEIIDLEKLKTYTNIEIEKNNLYVFNGNLKNTITFVKQADTIEELCDEFVLVAEDYDYFQTTRKITRKWVFDDLANAEQKEDEIGKGISRTIYGAIWTENGLIFVSKENIKGELELL